MSQVFRRKPLCLRGVYPVERKCVSVVCNQWLIARKGWLYMMNPNSNAVQMAQFVDAVAAVVTTRLIMFHFGWLRCWGAVLRRENYHRLIWQTTPLTDQVQPAHFHNGSTIVHLVFFTRSICQPCEETSWKHPTECFFLALPNHHHITRMGSIYCTFDVASRSEDYAPEIKWKSTAGLLCWRRHCRYLNLQKKIEGPFISVVSSEKKIFVEEYQPSNMI